MPVMFYRVTEPFGLFTVDASTEGDVIKTKSGVFDPDGTYRLRGVAYGSCLGYDDTKGLNGSECKPVSTFQNFKLESTGGGNYNIHHLTSDKCLYHNDVGKFGADACLSTALDQHWQVKEDKDSVTRLINAQSGDCLTIDTSGTVSMSHCEDGKNAQRFHLDKQAL